MFKGKETQRYNNNSCCQLPKVFDMTKLQSSLPIVTISCSFSHFTKRKEQENFTSVKG